MGWKLLTLFISLSLQIHAGEITDESLKKIGNEGEQILLDPAKREEAAKASPEGKKALDNVKSLAGSSENQQLIYKFAADIFKTLNQKTGGDVKKMEEVLQNALKDPEGFANQLTPEQRKMLNEISHRIPAGNRIP